MELLPIRTSRHQMDASFTEQLLEGSANDFQYRQQQQRRRRHRPRHGDGPIIYATPVSQYQPPDGGRQESDNSVADLEPYLFFNEYPYSLSISPTILRVMGCLLLTYFMDSIKTSIPLYGAILPM